MSLPSCREIRNQLFILVGAATAALAATTVLLDDNKTFVNPQASAQSTFEAQPVTAGEFSWDDVNLSGQVRSPEDDVKTARSKMLGDFEAR